MEKQNRERKLKWKKRATKFRWKNFFSLPATVDAWVRGCVGAWMYVCINPVCVILCVKLTQLNRENSTEKRGAALIIETDLDLNTHILIVYIYIRSSHFPFPFFFLNFMKNFSNLLFIFFLYLYYYFSLCISL